MILLKQVIHYTTTNGCEATWVDRTITPQPEVPEVPGKPAVEYQPAVEAVAYKPAVPYQPAVEAAFGVEAKPEVLAQDEVLAVEGKPEVLAQDAVPGTPAYTPDPLITDVQIKCHSYADVQMQMFRDDAEALGTPLDDYEDMIAEVEAAIVPYVPPPPVVPQVISMRQARLALYGAGLLDDVEAAVAQSTKDVQIEWEFSSELRRDWPTLVLLAGALGLTDEQLDALFTQAATL